MKTAKFKKAPQAPKRFKSAFMFFSQEKHPHYGKELRQNGQRLSAPHVAKVVAEAWRELDPEERDVWEKKAELDKKRYTAEINMYTGPWKVPATRRARKDPTAPRRPMSAFLHYSKDNRSLVQSANPNVNNKDISRLLGKMWKESSDEVRAKYQQIEFEKRKVYISEIALWRERQKEKLDKQRLEREKVALSIATENKICLDATENNIKGVVTEKVFDPLLQNERKSQNMTYICSNKEYNNQTNESEGMHNKPAEYCHNDHIYAEHLYSSSRSVPYHPTNTTFKSRYSGDYSYSYNCDDYTLPRSDQNHQPHHLLYENSQPCAYYSYNYHGQSFHTMQKNHT